MSERHTSYIVMSTNPALGAGDSGNWTSHYGKNAKREATGLALRLRNVRVYRRTVTVRADGTKRDSMTLISWREE